MNLYICEICGDAYIGKDKPTDCPFCGARSGFIKPAEEALPVTEIKENISDLSKKNLLETLELETKANAIYLCMAGKAQEYKIMKMYKRLAKVELEHAIIAAKLLSVSLPEIKIADCSNDEIENFKKTIELENHASELYKKFVCEAEEEHIRKFFGALAQVESSHNDLIKKYL